MDKIQILIFTQNFVIVLGNLMTYAIIIRIIISWFTMGTFGHRGRIAQFFFDVTDPVLNLCRKLPHRIGMIDLSPLIALIGIDLFVRLIIIVIEKVSEL